MKAGRRPDSPWGHANRPHPESVDHLAIEADHLVTQIRPMLAGRPSAVQGAALAELLAIWITGHIDPRSEELTKDRRAELLAVHLTNVEELLPAIAKGMGLPW
jgi:hypothetical protein